MVLSRLPAHRQIGRTVVQRLIFVPHYWLTSCFQCNAALSFPCVWPVISCNTHTDTVLWINPAPSFFCTKLIQILKISWFIGSGSKQASGSCWPPHGARQVFSPNKYESSPFQNFLHEDAAPAPARSYEMILFHCIRQRWVFILI